MKLCDELDNLCAKFWWGQVGNERKIHWTIGISFQLQRWRVVWDFGI